MAKALRLKNILSLAKFKKLKIVIYYYMKAMIILSKEETNSKIKKLEKTVLEILEEFNVVANGGAATELSFEVEMPDADLKKAVKSIESFAKKDGFVVEVLEE